MGPDGTRWDTAGHDGKRWDNGGTRWDTMGHGGTTVCSGEMEIKKFNVGNFSSNFTFRKNSHEYEIMEEKMV